MSKNSGDLKPSTSEPITDGTPLTQQNQLYPQIPRGQGMCYVPGCPNASQHTCSMAVCCTTFTCKRQMCEDHASERKCWPGSAKYTICNRVCLECEPNAKRKTRKCAYFQVSAFLTFFILFFVFRYVLI